MVQSVELVLDEALEGVVRAQWGRLSAAGLPSQAEHPGVTNRPHVTLAVASAVTAAAEADLVPVSRSLPVPLRLGGLVCFGGRGERGGRGGSRVLARLVVPHPELLAVQARAAEAFDGLPGTDPHLRPGAWTPHVTLARRVPVERVGEAILALAEMADEAGDAISVRRWDSEARRTWSVEP